MSKRKKKPKSRNPMATVVREPLFRNKIIPNKKKEVKPDKEDYD